MTIITAKYLTANNQTNIGVDSETSTNVKYSKIDTPILLKATEDGYAEVMSGTYEEVKTEYDRLVQENEGILYEDIEGFRAEERNYNRNSSFVNPPDGDVGNSKQAGSQGL